MSKARIKETKTDNTAPKLKTNLRLNNLPKPKDNELMVLDAFSGFGTLWNSVTKIKKCNVLSIDSKSIPGRVMLRGDNVKFIKGMDLSKFDIIDADAYGSPFPVIDAVFHNRTVKNIRIFFTFIRTGFGTVSKNMLFSVGISSSMYKKIKAIFNRNGFIYFLHYLSLWGIAEVFYYKLFSGEYYYGFFDFNRKNVK